MIINHNMASLNTYNKLSSNTSSTAKSLEKLSSGLRINKAGDDAAGLAISEKMRGQIRGLDQATRNAQDGISLIQTAEGSLSETQSILQRMKELATQSANDTNVSADRSEIQKEINQLTSEINRIGNTTEFNTQKLLKGKDVTVVSTAQTVGTTIAGEAGVVTGAASALAVNASSVVAVSSQTSVQGNTADATGAVGTTAQTTPSVAGAKSVASLSNGLTFKSVATNSAMNGDTILIKQLAGTSQASTVTSAAGVITFNIGTGADDKSLFTGDDRGSLTNFLKGIAGGVGYAGAGITLDDPVGAASAEKLIGFQDSTAVATAQTYSTGTMAGGVTEVRGVNTFTVSDKFEEAGDTVTVGGQTFTAKTSGANAANGEFNIGATNAFTIAGAVTAAVTDVAAATNSSLAITVDGTAYTVSAAMFATYGTGVGKTSDDVVTLLKNAANGGAKLSDVADVSVGSDNKIQIVAKTGGDLTGANDIIVAVTNGADALGAAITTLTGLSSGNGTNGAATGATAADQARSLRVAVNANTTLNTTYTASGSATAGQVVMTENANKATGIALAQVTVAGSGADDKLVITDNSGRNLKTVTLAQTAGDDMTVTGVDGQLVINLANASAYKNTAAEIQKAVHALGTIGGVDFTQYEITAQGNWDTKATGDNMVSKNATLVGGTLEVKGDYSFDITKAFAVGDKVQINGQTFSAVASGAIGSKGEFDISGGDVNQQAASLRDALSLNSTLKATYTTGGSGATISLTEKVASGTDLKSTDLTVRATGTAGEFSVDTSTLLENGAAFVLDGTEIAVSSKNVHVGYADGTAVKVADSAAAQTSALADAINTNADLNVKYTASVGTDGSLVLKQNDMEESATAPVVATKNSSIGQFTSSLQIGANSGQSMTVDVGDMRAASLGVSGDGSASTIAASNGKVASYVSVANTTDGTNNTSTEFSLDVSTHEKATNAISVLEDAIQAVSAERSKLGAFQNRLEHTISNLGTSSENLTGAESRIRDVDMAKEMMQFQKNNILAQAATAMLAQANQQPQGVLQLLR